jgi:putative phage-type endonuclease
MQAIQCATRDEWLQRRRQGCGASEGAAILGIHPHLTALEVYLRKIAEIPEREQTPVMRRGLRLERFVAQEYAEETGRELQKPPTLLIHPEAPWCLASLDYWIPGERVVQIKTCDRWFDGFGEPGTSEVPNHYAVQVQQEMAVSGLPVAEIALLRVASWDFARYTIERNDKLIAELLEAEREFMGRVVRRDPPLPDFTHPSTAEILAMIEPREGETVFLDDDAQTLADEYQALSGQEREAKKRREEIKARLTHLLGQAAVGELPDGRAIHRKKIAVRGYTVQPREDIRLSITKG